MLILATINHTNILTGMLQLFTALMARLLRRRNTSIHRFRRRSGRSSTCHPLLSPRESNGQAPSMAFSNTSLNPEPIAPVSHHAILSHTHTHITYTLICFTVFHTEQLPTPVRIRQTEANEDAPLSEFQQELVQLAAVLKGENILTSFPGNIGKNMTVRQGTDYMESAVKSFFEAGLAAKKMGVNSEQIVKMRPSLSTRS